MNQLLGSEHLPNPNFKPLFSNVLITLEEASEIVEGSEVGIVKPQTAQEKPEHGTVLAVGFQAINVKRGDRVLFGKYSGKPVEVDGVKYQYMKEQEIIGIFTLTSSSASG